MHNRRGVSSVVTTVIMTAVVLSIGMMVWIYTAEASSLLQSDYFGEVMASAEKIEERFCIENIGANTAESKLRVWIYNFGKVDITVDVIRVRNGGSTIYATFKPNTPIPVGEMRPIELTGMELAKGMSLSLEAITTRGNKAYEATNIPV